MLVQFRTNLGSRDATRFDLDHMKCTEGAVVEVDDKLGADLCSKDADGLVFAVPADAPKKLKAVAPEPEIKADAKAK